MSGFESRAAAALADPHKRANVPRFAERAADNRVRGLEGIDFEALRTAGEAARSRAIADLPALLDTLQEKLEAAGVVVHRAPTGADAAAYVTEVVLRHGRMAVKGKSMAAEEIGLNERLEAAGVEVVETDLGEFIVQTAGEAPEHIIIPAIHKTTDQVRDLFEPLAGRPIGDDPAELTAFARAPICAAGSSRRRVGITGVNFAVAETGTIVLVTNEGNGRMCSSLPPVHIAIMGMERVVAELADLAVLLPLLTRSGHRPEDHLVRHAHERAAPGRRAGRARGDARRDPRQRPLARPRDASTGASCTASAAAPARTSAPSTARSAAPRTGGSTEGRSARS